MSVAGVCRIVASILHNVQLTYVAFDQGTSACVGHDAWRSEGLPVPPASVVSGRWSTVLEHLRKVCICSWLLPCTCLKYALLLPIFVCLEV